MFFIQPLSRHLSVYRTYREPFLPRHLIYLGFFLKREKSKFQGAEAIQKRADMRVGTWVWGEGPLWWIPVYVYFNVLAEAASQW